MAAEPVLADAVVVVADGTDGVLVAVAGGAGSGGVRLHAAARTPAASTETAPFTARREVIPDSSHGRADKRKRHRVRARGGGSLNAVPPAI